MDEPGSPPITLRRRISCQASSSSWGRRGHSHTASTPSPASAAPGRSTPVSSRCPARSAHPWAPRPWEPPAPPSWARTPATAPAVWRTPYSMLHRRHSRQWTRLWWSPCLGTTARRRAAVSARRGTPCRWCHRRRRRRRCLDLDLLEAPPRLGKLLRVRRTRGSRAASSTSSVSCRRCTREAPSTQTAGTAAWSAARAPSSRFRRSLSASTPCTPYRRRGAPGRAPASTGRTPARCCCCCCCCRLTTGRPSCRPCPWRRFCVLSWQDWTIGYVPRGKSSSAGRDHGTA